LVCANCHAIRTYKRMKKRQRQRVAQLEERLFREQEAGGADPLTLTKEG
jgi:hypothetical protein